MKITIPNRLAALCLLCALALCAASALADDQGAKYTIKTKGVTVLQNVDDRSIAVNETDLAPNPVISGESGVTGLPLQDGQLYYPMLASISNEAGDARKRAPWGGQWADIVYETILVRTGQTRMTYLFSDSFAQGQPAEAGPVRSARIGAAMLHAEWQGGFVYAGGPRGQEDEIGAALAAEGSPAVGAMLNLFKSGSYRAFANRVTNIKAPANMNVDIAGLRAFLDGREAQPRPFLFADASPYGDGYAPALAIHLDWGNKSFVSDFNYDEASGLYQRFSGKTPCMTYPDSAAAESKSEAELLPMAFRNVIVQRVYYDYVSDNKLQPVMRCLGRGNADIFIGGRYIAGYWVRERIASPTVFFDDQGNELRLARGKTFIAHFPVEARLTFGAAR